MRKKWALGLTVAMMAALMAAPAASQAAEEEEDGGNNLATPVIFAEGYGLSGFLVDPADVTSTGMPGLLKPACSGVETWGDPATVTYPAGTTADFALQIDGTIYDELDGAGTPSPGNYHLQPYSLVPLAGGTADVFGDQTCWEADWADGSAIDMVEADSVDVGDSLVRVLRSAGPSPIRVEFTLYQTTDTAGTFQDGTTLWGYPMTQLWPPSVAEGQPPAAGGGEKLEVWGTADSGGEGTMAAAEAASVYTRNARLTIDKLSWSVLPDNFSDGDLDGYPSGVIPDTFEDGYEDWVASVVYDGLGTGAEGGGGFSSEVNQGGRVLYGYNWTNPTSGWYRLTLSIDDAVGDILANASITGVNPDDQAADEEGEEAVVLAGMSKGFFPPTFVEDLDGNYLFIDVYIAPDAEPGSGNMNGKVTNSAGATLGGIDATVYNSAGNPVGMDTTGSDGLFGMTLAAGTYNVGFSDPSFGYLSEFFNDRSTLTAADDVTVTAGQTTFLNASLAARTVAALSTGFGIVDTATGRWYLREPIDGDTTAFYYGTPGDIPMVGDWDCDGDETPGLYRRSNGFVYLRNSNTQGVGEINYFFGIAGDIPIAGDFDGDGCDTVSIYRPSEGRVYIINDLGTAYADYSYYFGVPGDKPFAGDFNADGVDTIGLHRESTGLVYLRQTNTQGFADSQFIYGLPGDKIMAGDWTGDGIDTVGIFRPSNSTVYLRFANTQGFADFTLKYGLPTGLPVAGDFGALPGGSAAPGG